MIELLMKVVRPVNAIFWTFQTGSDTLINSLKNAMEFDV